MTTAFINQTLHTTRMSADLQFVALFCAAGLLLSVLVSWMAGGNIVVPLE